MKFWGNNGYVETFEGYKRNWTNEVKDIIIDYVKSKTVLEIGCGGGHWTKILCEHASKVYAIDLLPKAPFVSNKLNYIENKDMQFNCSNIQDNSIDFVFSFGTFCHFSQDACEEYLKDIMRVLKKGGTAILMYCDREGLVKFYNNPNSVGKSYFGEFVDYDDIMPMVIKYDEKARKILDIKNGFRDCLILITK